MFSKKDNSSDGLKKRPSFKQWLQLFKVMNRKERTAFGIISLVFALSLILLASSVYISHTTAVPADTGKIREGTMGLP